MNLMRISERALNRPVLLQPAYSRFFYAYLSKRIGAESLQIGADTFDKDEMQALASNYERGGDKVYQVIDDVAIIPVEGTLVHKFGYLNPTSGMTGYDGIEIKLNEALNDKDIKGVMLDINSPGGELSGCFELALKIQEFNKPIIAYLDDMACSAAYALASSCDAIYMPETGYAGSVGVLNAHTDISKALEDEGVKVTLIYSGDHKVDGNPYVALPDAVKADIQTELDKFYSMFTNLVANSRGMGNQSVIDTQAKTYVGQDAVNIGFADAVMSKQNAFTAFLNELTPTGSDKSGAYMSDDKTTREDAGNEPAMAYTEDEMKDAIALATLDATQAERDRTFTVLTSEVVRGREATAVQLLKSSEMDAESILATLETTQIKQVIDIKGAGVEAEDESIDEPADIQTLSGNALASL